MCRSGDGKEESDFHVRVEAFQFADLVAGLSDALYVRDTTWREDDQQAHTGSGPQVMASIRNLAMGCSV
ncbi:hypothetical protein FRAHR75_1190016 [Frankia sp. Hr75.2]|nr:hypothetical protein FRAHR75_1190016 [Frankia sp. Hr75.2]